MTYYFVQYLIDDQFSSDVFVVMGSLTEKTTLESLLQKKYSENDFLLVSEERVTEKEYKEYNTTYAYV